LPELPEAKRERFHKEYKLKKDQVEILINDPDLAEYFEEAVSEEKEEKPAPVGEARSAKERPTAVVQTLFNYLVTDIVGTISAKGMGIKVLREKIPPHHFAHVGVLIEEGKLSSRMAKDLIEEMLQTGLDPEEIINQKGMVQVSDEDSLKKAIEEVITENPAALEDYKKGKGNAVQFLVGKAMAKLQGKGNPQAIQKLLAEVLTKLQ
jgi:aspartyl-tRNA(Asn)/glutamyl-tRNA(Gln) amidotransferase subunit B